MSMFDLQDPSNRDRVAMLRTGMAMVAADPLTGVGPNMVPRAYPAYRDPSAVEAVNPHLHNVPMQIAAERGLPALADLARLHRHAGARALPAVSRRRRLRPCAPRHRTRRDRGDARGRTLRYNFGDSEFLMLFLVLVTLPFAASRAEKQ